MPLWHVYLSFCFARPPCSNDAHRAQPGKFQTRYFFATNLFGKKHALCTALHFTVPHSSFTCVVFHCTAQHSAALNCTAVHCAHDDVTKWKYFRVTGHLCGEFTGPPVNSPHKGKWRGALMFSLICARINGWENNGEAGDLRSHRDHYDVTVMQHRIIPHCTVVCCVVRHCTELYCAVLYCIVLYCTMESRTDLYYITW